VPTHFVTQSFQKEYLDGIQRFNEGHYFEAHEIWEKLWLEAQDMERVFYQGLIQMAAALLKLQEGKRPEACRRLFQLALEKLGTVPNSYLGLDVRKLEKDLKEYFNSGQVVPKITLIP